MNKKRITKLIVSFIFVLGFLINPLKVSGATFKEGFNTKNNGYISGRGIMGIYKAIYNQGYSWLDAPSYYIGGDGDNSDAYWMGEAGMTEAELNAIGLNSSDKIINSKFGACVGHQSQNPTEGDNRKLVRAININLDNSYGEQYKHGKQNNFSASPLDVLTLAVGAQYATTNSDGLYKKALISYWRDNKTKFIIDGTARNYISHSSDSGEEADATKIGEIKQRASEIASQKLETKSTDKDLIYAVYDESSNYTFIGPYKITTAGVNWDTLKAKITTESGKTYDNIYTFTFNKKTIYKLDGKVPNPDPYKSGTISSDTFYIAVSGKIDGAVKTIELRRIYWTVRSRVVAVFGIAQGGQNFILFEGQPVNGWIDLKLPNPKGIELKIKKVDKDTGTELPGARFVVQDVNTKEYIANTKSGSVSRVTNPGKNFENVTKLASGSTFRIDKDGTYRYLEIQQQKIAEGSSNSYYEIATPEKPIEVGTIEVKNFKVTKSTANISYQVNSNGTSTTVTLKNAKKYFWFKVYKTDANTRKTLYNVKFVIKHVPTGKYVKFDNKKEAEYVSNIKSATQFSIPKGKEYAEIDFLTEEGKYEVYEVERENDLYLYVSVDKPLLKAITEDERPGKKGSYYEFHIENPKRYRPVLIKKVDERGKEVPNMKLVIRDEGTGKYFIEGSKESGPSLTNDIRKATCYVTKAGGNVVKNLPMYKNNNPSTKIKNQYSIWEVGSDTENGFRYASYDEPVQLPLSLIGVNKKTDIFTLNETNENQTFEVTAVNTRVYKNIKIIKKDKDSGKEIDGVGLILHDDTKNQYFIQGNTGKASSLTNNIKEATVYMTKKGGVDVNKLVRGRKYTVLEVITSPEKGYPESSYEKPIKVKNIEIPLDSPVERSTITIENQKKYRNIKKLIKIDTDSGEEIDGVGLVFYDETKKGYFIQGDIGKDSDITNDIKKATLYMTKRGGIDVNKLVIGRKYTVWEVISNPENGYKGTSYDKPLQINDLIVTKDGNQQVKREAIEVERTKENEDIKLTVKNQKIYRNIKVIKRDKDTNQEISGFGLIFYDKTAGKYFVQGATGKDSELTSDIKKATLYITKKGGIDVNKLVIGHEYVVYEVISDPDIGYEFTGYGSPYKPLNVKEFRVERDKQNARIEVTVYNKKVYMNANIKKVDEDQRNKELNGIGFVLYDIENKKYVVSGAPCTFVNSIKDATIFKSQSGGIKIKYLARHHSYIIYEVENSIYGYTDVSLDKPLKIGEFTLSGNDATLDYTATNLKITGNLIIEKKDKDNDKYVLDGVRFKLKNSDGKYIVALDENKKVQMKVNGKIYLGGMLTTTNPNGATEFVTDSNSRVEIYNILMGKYQVIETSIGDKFGYDIDEEYVSWETSTSSGNGLTATVVVNRQKSQYTELSTANIKNGKYDKLTVKNKRKFIKISGFAWEDIANSPDNETDNIWKENTKDKKLKDITVKIWSSQGTLLASKITNSDGNYVFGNYDEDPKATKIKIDDIVGGNIEFEYNGMSYKTVSINSKFNLEKKSEQKSVINGIDNSATDTTQRDAFSSNYAIISNNKSHTSNGSVKYQLKYNYDKKMHESELTYGDNVKYGYEGQKYPSAGVNQQYLINAVTQKNSGKALCTQYSADDIRKNSVIEIAGVNLGITLREQADLAVASDLNTVDIKVTKGAETYNNTYTYAKRDLDGDSIDNFGMDVKFGINSTAKTSYTDRGLHLYTRRIYESDLAWANSDESKELMQIYVTYRIRVKNQASTLSAKVSELVNYYDARYTIEESWVADNLGNKTANATWGTSKYQNNAKMESGYTAKYTTALENIEIGPNEYKDIYIKFKLNRDAVKELLNKQTTLNNVSEISAFSTFENGKVYAAIDQDSNPGSAEIKLKKPSDTTTASLHNNTYQIENKTLDTETYEDDTDYAPALILGIEDTEPTRGLSGIVFEDSNKTKDSTHGDETKTHPTEERIGDGIYKQGENGVENVKVELLNEDGTVATLYQLIVKNGIVTVDNKPAEVETGPSGEYSLLGVLPGRYLIRYTYDNNTKINGKIIDCTEYKSTIITSDIMKNALDLNSTPSRKGNLNWILTYDEIPQNDKEEAKSKKTDVSGLKRFSDAVDDLDKRAQQERDGIYYGNLSGLNYEMSADTAYFDVGVEYTEVQEKESNERVSFTDYKDEYDSVDGKIDVIKEGKIKLSDKFYAINPYQDFGLIERPRQSYEINKRISYIKLTLVDEHTIINGNPYQQIPDAEVYKEWKNLESAAKGENALPYTKALPSQVVAEIDNEIIQGAKLELEFTISLKNDSEKDFEYKNDSRYYYYGTITDGLQPIKTSVKKVVDYMQDDLIYDTKKNEQLGWKNVTADELYSYTEETGLSKQLISDETKKDVEKGYIISINTKFGDMHLNSGDAASIRIYGSKLLSSKESGIGASNHVEIIETSRKMFDVTPGNYNPKKSPLAPQNNEKDSSYTSVSITPPTGQTDNKIFIISILGASLIALAGGVYFIKKKVLK